MGWVISGAIILLGFVSGVMNGHVGGDDAGLICTVWGIAGVIWAYAIYATGNKRAAKKRVAKLFKPHEISWTFESFAKFCSDIIALTPERYRKSIEIHLYAGKFAGDTCAVNMSITNFDYRNMRDLCPAYLYAESLGWEVSHGMIRTKDGTRLEVSEGFVDTLLRAGKSKAFEEVLNKFTSNCSVVKPTTNTGTQDDGFFVTYKVK